MNILGIDPSLSGTGLCLLSEENNNIEVLTAQVIKTKKDDFKDDTDRIIHILCEIEKAVEGLDIDKIVIEDISYGSRGRIAQLAGLNYAIRIIFRVRNIPIIVLSPRTIKKQFSGSGNASKTDMLISFNSQFQNLLTNKDNNIIDAFAAAYTQLKKEIEG